MCACPPPATLSSSPIPASTTSRLDEPLEMKGSGTPVSGASPSTAKTLSSAWLRMSDVTPHASSAA